MASAAAHLGPVKRTRLRREQSDADSARLRQGLDGSSSDNVQRADVSKRRRIGEQVRAAMKSMATRLREQLRNSSRLGVDLRSLFQSFDADRDGMISIGEFRHALSRMGFEPTKKELRNLQRVLDVDRDGLISYSEFLRFVGPMQSRASMERESPARDGDDTPSARKKKLSSRRRSRRSRSQSADAGSGSGTSKAAATWGGSGGGSGFGAGAGARAGAGAGASASAPGSDGGGGVGAGALAGTGLSASSVEWPMTHNQAQIALACAAMLGRRGVLSPEQKGSLKDLIVRHDSRVQGAVVVFDEDGDTEELLDTLVRVARLSSPKAAARHHPMSAL